MGEISQVRTFYLHWPFKPVTSRCLVHLMQVFKLHPGWLSQTIVQVQRKKDLVDLQNWQSKKGMCLPDILLIVVEKDLFTRFSIDLWYWSISLRVSLSLFTSLTYWARSCATTTTHTHTHCVGLVQSVVEYVRTHLYCKALRNKTLIFLTLCLKENCVHFWRYTSFHCLELYGPMETALSVWVFNMKLEQERVRQAQQKFNLA